MIFFLPPTYPPPGSKRSSKSKSGGPAVDFRASIVKKVLLEIVSVVKYNTGAIYLVCTQPG